MDYDGFLQLLSITAIASTLGLFLCGLQICFRIRQRGTTDGTGVAPFWMTSVSCICWYGYGVLRDNNTIKFVNGIGLIIQTLYFIYYYTKTRLKHSLHKLILVELVVFMWTYWLVSTTSVESKENLLGIVCTFLNIATIASPLLDVGQVVRTQSIESLPFMLCVGNMAVSVQWLLYGLLVDDFYMKVPNTVATIISAIQLSLFIIYPSKHKIVLVTKNTESLL